MTVEHMTETADAPLLAPMLVDVRCAACRIETSFLVTVDEAKRLFGQSVTFSCTCGHGYGLVFQARGIGEAAR